MFGGVSGDAERWQSFGSISSVEAIYCSTVHTGKYFPNLIESNRDQIVFIMHWLIRISKRTVSVCCSKSIEENSKYNLISVWFNKIWKIFLCVYRTITACIELNPLPAVSRTQIRNNREIRNREIDLFQKYFGRDCISESFCISEFFGVFRLHFANSEIMN